MSVSEALLERAERDTVELSGQEHLRALRVEEGALSGMIYSMVRNG